MRPKRSTKRLAAIGTIDFGAVVETIKLHLAEMSQREIAQAMGMTPIVVSHWFTGYRVPLFRVIERLARVAGGELIVRFNPQPKQTK